jgi:predicted amidohydrolase
VSEERAELRSQRVWCTLQDAFALLYQTWIVYVNRVGSEDGVLFAGGSRVVDPCGREVARLDGLEPGRLEARLTGEALRRARVSTPLRRDEKPWIVARELGRLRGGRPGMSRSTVGPQVAPQSGRKGA